MSIKEFDYTGPQVSIPGQVPTGASDIPTKAYADAILGGTTYSPNAVTSPDLGSLMAFNGTVWQAVSRLDNLKLRNLTAALGETLGIPEDGTFEYIDGALYFTVGSTRHLVTPLTATYPPYAIDNSETQQTVSTYIDKLSMLVPVAGDWFVTAMAYTYCYSSSGGITLAFNSTLFAETPCTSGVAGYEPTPHVLMAAFVNASAGDTVKLQYRGSGSYACYIKQARMTMQRVA